MLYPFAFFNLGLEMARLASEAQAVIALRLARISVGDAAAGTEIMRMMTEKALAAGEAGMHVAVAAATGNLDNAARDVVVLYRRRVRANRRRLSR
ncbi:MAG: hypothetical protein K0R27_1867 [Xanthobacteraceae bacterium]|jgi:hypothetical protein|nr:hypothetical protein [Xanthobacteraceae bacterium]